MIANSEDRQSENVMSEKEEISQADVVPAHSEVVKEHPVEGPGRGRALLILFVAAAAAAIIYGIRVRSSDEKKLKRATEESAIMSVRVTSPAVGAASQDLILPGNVQAFTEAPIYSRSDG